MAKAGNFEFEQWLESFNNRIREARFPGSDESNDVQAMTATETAFTAVCLETLEDRGQIPSLQAAYYEKKVGRANAKCNAYGFAENDRRLDLVVTIANGGAGEDDSENGDTNVSPVPAGEILAAIKKGVHLFRSAKEPLHEEMEFASAAYDLMDTLHKVRDDTRQLRIIVLIAGRARKLPEYESLKDVPDTQVDIWDLERLYRADSSELYYESFTINVLDHLEKPLPCLEGPVTSEDHHCYLTIIPGILLHDLYHRYGPRLLELNVRSFLQARGKVNKGIRNTINEDPGHFLTYNNGISITAEKLELKKNPDGSMTIVSIRGLQVVNGGQTVASIHRAKDGFRADLSDVHVQAKITVVDDDHRDVLAPNISRFSNTQNTVNETDFSANHPFHVKIQKLSEAAWVPGETSRWFYERARGQWDVAKTRTGQGRQQKVFDQTTPRQQKVDKTLLAKVTNSWDQLPDFVSQGGQKNFKKFMDLLAERGEDWEPDTKYFKDMISKVILFKRAEKIAREIGFSAYRANAVCYTVALLAYRTTGRVQLDQVWENQDVSASLEATLRSWMPLIYEEIVRSAADPGLHPKPIENVTEWCKKKECWLNIRQMQLDFSPGFEEELTEGMPTPNVGQYKNKKTNKRIDLTDAERQRQARTTSYDSDQWFNIIKWAEACNEIDEYPKRVAGTVLNYAIGGWKHVPSPSQTKHTDAILDLWEKSGNTKAEQ